MIKNVIIAGVGGQGTIFAGKILGTMAYQTGLHVKISEIHGMSQRGGSVVTQVRFGKHVYAPLAQAGEVDVLIALEELEALRYASAAQPRRRFRQPPFAMVKIATLADKSGRFAVLPLYFFTFVNRSIFFPHFLRSND